MALNFDTETNIEGSATINQNTGAKMKLVE